MTIRLHIRRSWDVFAEEWFLWESDNQGGTSILSYNKDVRSWEKRHVSNSGAFLIPSDLQPTFVIPASLSKPFSQAFIEALGHEGFVSERHEGARAKLEAVAGHLADMRKLVFEHKEPETFARDLISDLKGQINSEVSETRRLKGENERLVRIEQGDKCEIRGLHQERDGMIQQIATLRDQLGEANVSVAVLTNRLKRKRR